MRQASNVTQQKLLADEQVCWQTFLTLLIQVRNVTDLCPVSFTLRMRAKFDCSCQLIQRNASKKEQSITKMRILNLSS